MDFETYLEGLRGKTAAVIGIGVSNRPLIELLLRRHVAVTARDRKSREALGPLAEELAVQGCRFRLGEDYLQDLTEDVIFRTPGLRPAAPELAAAVARGSVLTSEMEAFFEVCPCHMIAITGSDGKTTTSTILSELLKAEGKTVWLGGNIGRPLLCDTPKMRPEDYAVLELSSFQLMTMQRSPAIAVVTNLSPNHLDVHKSYQEYVEAKENVFLHQGRDGVAVFNADNADSRKSAGKAPGEVRWFSRQGRVANGVFLEDGMLYQAEGGAVTPILPISDIALPGMHNVENYMAAFAAVRGLVSPEHMDAVARSFHGVEHRIERIRVRRGVRWYNDSIASSPSRTIAGLKSFPEKVILIAGGKDKGISYDAIGPEINRSVKYLILCGATAAAIRESVEKAENYAGLPIREVRDYREAVALADEVSGEGDVVILSPASTSFDRFANFMERGRVFKDIVNALPD